MKDLNSVQLIGRLGQDPEVTITERGTTRTTFSLATSRRWTDANGQVQNETEWSRSATWGQVAEVAAEYLHTGSRVYVQGRLHTSRWQDPATNDPHSSVEIVVDDLILLNRPTPSPMSSDEQDVEEPPSTQVESAPTPQPTAQRPIRWPPQRVQLPPTAVSRNATTVEQQPASRRRRTD